MFLFYVREGTLMTTELMLRRCGCRTEECHDNVNTDCECYYCDCGFCAENHDDCTCDGCCEAYVQ